MENIEKGAFAIWPVMYLYMYGTKKEKDIFQEFLDSLQSRHGEKIFFEGENKNWLYVKSEELVELKNPKKCEEGFLPYYDINALRNVDNPDWVQRDGFKFTDSGKNKVIVEKRGNRAYINKGHLAEKGDLLLSATGTIGDTFICPERCYITPSLKIVRFKYNLIDTEFFRIWVEQHKKQMISDVQSVYVPNLNKKAFNEYLLPISPKQEQQKIVEKFNSLISIVDKI